LLVDLLPIVQRTPLTSALAAARSSASADQQANRKGDQPGPNRFHFAFLFTPPLARWPLHSRQHRLGGRALIPWPLQVEKARNQERWK